MSHYDVVLQMSQIPISPPDVAAIAKFVTKENWTVIFKSIKNFSFGDLHNELVKKTMERAYNDGSFLENWHEFQRLELGCSGRLRRAQECNIRSTYNVIENMCDVLQDEDYCDESVEPDNPNQCIVDIVANNLPNAITTSTSVYEQNNSNTGEATVNVSVTKLKQDCNAHLVVSSIPKTIQDNPASILWHQQMTTPSKVNTIVPLLQHRNLKSAKTIARKKIDFALKRGKYENKSHVPKVHSNIQLLQSEFSSVSLIDHLKVKLNKADGEYDEANETRDAQREIVGQIIKNCNTTVSNNDGINVVSGKDHSTACTESVESSDEESKYFVETAPWKRLKISTPLSKAVISNESQKADNLIVVESNVSRLEKNELSNIASTSANNTSSSKYSNKKKLKPVYKYNGPEVTLTMTQILPGAQKLKRKAKHFKAHKLDGKKLKKAYNLPN